MQQETRGGLRRRIRYLQVALNSTLEEARDIIQALPASDRILIEVGTPLIKRYGEYSIRQIREWWQERLWRGEGGKFENNGARPYIVADLKMMDRGAAEAEIAARGGANAAVALGHAPVESLNAFVRACRELEIDATVDMMHVPFPLAVLRELRELPDVVILHRGVDEERDNKEKTLPLHEIRRIKGNYDILVSVAGGDTFREVQSAVFNDADIVVVWKSFYHRSQETTKIAEAFLQEIK